MPFIGKQPQAGAYSKLDAITTSATATYNLTLGGSAYYPSSANHLLVSLNGVLQAPQDSFTVSGSQITFDSALTSEDSIDFIMALGEVLDIGTPSAGATVPGAFNVAGDLTVNYDSTSKIKFNNPSADRNNYVGIRSSDNIEIAADEDDQGPDSTIRFRIDGSEAARFRPTSNGYGITFNGDNTDATTLDDYETGTWTPTYGGSTSDPTITYSTQTGGTYTKIGRVVYITGRLRTTAASGGSGSLTIEGIPFALSSGVDDSSTTQETSSAWAIAQSEGFSSVQPKVIEVTTSGIVLFTASGSDFQTSNLNTVVGTSNLSASGNNRIRFSGFYITDE